VNANNQITVNQMATYTYDSAGNVDTISGTGGASYVYNAENQLTSTAGVTYTYDGEGKRVEKSTGPLYWYGMSGEVLEEILVNGAVQNDHVYFGGSRIAKRDASGDIFAYFSDHLRSSRKVEEIAVGASTAVLTYDADFYPFGAEHAFISSTSPTCKFNGKERDIESNLDNFVARYFGSSPGRFMSADSLGPGQHPENPQSWNMYSYVPNNPLKLVDPTGQFTCAPTVVAEECDNFQKLLDKAQDAADALGEKIGWESKQYVDAQRAIDAYGDEGVDNGVTISQGNTGQYGAETFVGGNVSAKTADNPNGQNILVTFNSGLHLLDSGDNAGAAALAAHEGVHVADGSDWVSSGFSANANPSRFQTERDAYAVAASIYEGLGYSSFHYQIGATRLVFSAPPVATVEPRRGSCSRRNIPDSKTMRSCATRE